MPDFDREYAELGFWPLFFSKMTGVGAISFLDSRAESDRACPGNYCPGDQMVNSAPGWSGTTLGRVSRGCDC